MKSHKICFRYIINCFLKANFHQSYHKNPCSFLLTVNVYILNVKEENRELIYNALSSFIQNFVLFCNRFSKKCFQHFIVKVNEFTGQKINNNDYLCEIR